MCGKWNQPSPPHRMFVPSAMMITDKIPIWKRLWRTHFTDIAHAVENMCTPRFNPPLSLPSWLHIHLSRNDAIFRHIGEREDTRAMRRIVGILKMRAPSNLHNIMPRVSTEVAWIGQSFSAQKGVSLCISKVKSFSPLRPFSGVKNRFRMIDARH